VPANPLLGGVNAGGAWAAIGVVPPGEEAVWQGSFGTSPAASQLLQTSPSLATGSSLAGVLNLLTILAEMFGEAPTAKSAQAVLDAAATVSAAPDALAIVQELRDPAPLTLAQHLFNVLSDDQQLAVLAAGLAQLDVIVTREALRKLLVWQRLIDLVGMIVDMAEAIAFGRSAAQILFSVSTPGQSAPRAPSVGTFVWQPMAPMPTLRFLPSVATGGDGRVYAIGGAASLADPVRAVEAFDPRTNSWTTVAPLPQGLATYLAAAATGRDGRIYVFGGGRGDGSNTVEIYDPVSNTWTSGAQMPTARGGLAAVLGPDQRIYAMGGDHALARDGTLSTVEVFDPRTKTWEVAAPMQTPRSNFGAAVAADGRIYAIGGAADMSVEAYSPVTNSWQPAPPTAGTRHWTAAATGQDGAVYSIGGVGSTVPPDTGEVYGLGPLPAPTYASAAAAAEAGTLAYLRLQDSSACFRVDASPLDAGEPDRTRCTSGAVCTARPTPPVAPATPW